MKTKKQNILTAYNESSCQETKETLKRLYPGIEFERRFPKTWEEYCDIKNIAYSSADMFTIEGFVKPIVDLSKTYATEYTKDEKFTAMNKLRHLRDYYNDGADFNNIEIACIYYDREDILNIYKYSAPSFLQFKMENNIAEKFLKNFKVLIIEADDLI